MKDIGKPQGVSVKNTMRYFRKFGSVYVLSKDPWAHLHPKHLVKDYHHAT